MTAEELSVQVNCVCQSSLPGAPLIKCDSCSVHQHLNCIFPPPLSAPIVFLCSRCDPDEYMLGGMYYRRRGRVNNAASNKASVEEVETSVDQRRKPAVSKKSTSAAAASGSAHRKETATTTKKTSSPVKASKTKPPKSSSTGEFGEPRRSSSRLTGQRLPRSYFDADTTITDDDEQNMESVVEEDESLVEANDDLVNASSADDGTDHTPTERQTRRTPLKKRKAQEDPSSPQKTKKQQKSIAEEEENGSQSAGDLEQEREPAIPSWSSQLQHYRQLVSCMHRLLQMQQQHPGVGSLSKSPFNGTTEKIIHSEPNRNEPARVDVVVGGGGGNATSTLVSPPPTPMIPEDNEPESLGATSEVPSTLATSVDGVRDEKGLDELKKELTDWYVQFVDPVKRVRQSAQFR